MPNLSQLRELVATVQVEFGDTTTNVQCYPNRLTSRRISETAKRQTETQRRRMDWAEALDAGDEPDGEMPEFSSFEVEVLLGSPANGDEPILVSWDLDDDGGTVPFTREAMAPLPAGYVSAVYTAISEYNSPNRKRSRHSRNGSRAS